MSSSRPLDDLAHDVRIGDVRARHAHHVELAGGDGVARRRDIGNARRMKGREFGRGADLAGEIEMRRRRHALDRDHVGQAGVGVDVSTHDVEEIDQAARLQAARNLQAVLSAQAAFEIFVGRVAQADDELGADALADRRQHLEGEPQPVVERTAVGRFEVVGERRPELIAADGRRPRARCRRDRPPSCAPPHRRNP